MTPLVPGCRGTRLPSPKHPGVLAGGSLPPAPGSCPSILNLVFLPGRSGAGWQRAGLWVPAVIDGGDGGKDAGFNRRRRLTLAPGQTAFHSLPAPSLPLPAIAQTPAPNLTFSSFSCAKSSVSPPNPQRNSAGPGGDAAPSEGAGPCRTRAAPRTYLSICTAASNPRFEVPPALFF